MTRQLKLRDRTAREAGFVNVVWLGVVSFFTDISTEMILGLLPLFILTELGGTRALLGLVEGLAEALSYVVRLFSGAISDRVGRRKLLTMVGYGFSTVAKPLFGLARVWSDALIIRGLDRVGKGVRTTPRDALLSESISAKDLGKAFGLHRSLDQVGAVVGPGLAILLLPLVGMRGIFWLSFLPAGVALLVLLLFVRESRVEPRRTSVFENVRGVVQGRFLLLLLILAIFSLGVYNFSFVLVKAFDLGVSTLLAYMVINISHTLVGFPSGFLADKIGKERTLTLSFGVFAFTSFLGFYLTGNPLYAYVIALVYGTYMGIAETVQRAVIPKYAPEALRGTAYGVYNLVIGFAFLFANVIFGLLSEYIGPATAFQYSLTMAIVALGGMLLFLRTNPSA